MSIAGGRDLRTGTDHEKVRHTGDGPGRYASMPAYRRFHSILALNNSLKSEARATL